MSEQPPDDDKPESRWPGIQSFLGDAMPGAWEWRDSLGCVWIVGVGAVLTVAIWLGELGVPTRALQVGTIVVLIGLVVGFWLIRRSTRDDS